MGVSIDDLPEPLRHAVLPAPVALFGILLSLLFVAALLQKTAPRPSLPLRGAQLAGLALLLTLAGLPWIGSLLWLPIIWSGVTWAGLLCLHPDAPPPAGGGCIAAPRPPGGTWLRQGVAADGLLALACALCFWSQAGTWSRAGAGYVVDVPPRTVAPGTETGTDAVRQEPPAPQLSLFHAARPASPDDATAQRWSQSLHNKRFFGLPLDWVLLALFLVALSLKLNMGLRLLRTGLLPPRGSGAPRRALWLLPALACPLLALQFWLQLRVQW